MVKGGVNIEAQTRDLIREIREKNFHPVYLLMGDEPYYPDLICQAIIDNCLEEWEQGEHGRKTPLVHIPERPTKKVIDF